MLLLAAISLALAAPPGGDLAPSLGAGEPALIPPSPRSTPDLTAIWTRGDGPAVEVRVLLQIDEAGAVIAARSLSASSAAPLSSTHEAAALAAGEAAALLMRFDPATEGGAPVAVEVPVTLIFPGAELSLGEAVGSWGRDDDPLRLDAAAVRRMPGSLDDPLRALQNLPALARAPLDSGWLLVRGGDPGDAALFIDGVRVPSLYHLGGFTSVLHPASVSAVAIQPAGGPASEGRALSGAVSLETAARGHADRPAGASPPERRAEVGVDLAHAGAFAQTPLERGAVTAAFRRSYLDRVMALAFGAEAASVAPRFYDWQLRWDGVDGGVSALGWSDAIDAPTVVEDQILTIRAAAQRVHGWAERGRGDWTLGVTPWAAWSRRQLESDGAVDALAELEAGARLQAGVGRSGWGATAGLEGEVGRAEVRSERASLGAPIGWLDPYVDVRWGGDDPGARRLLAGARLDTLFIGGQGARLGPSGRLLAALPAGERVTLEAGARLDHQPPPTDRLIGDLEGPYLEMERAWGPSAGLLWRGEGWVGRLDGFFRWTDRTTAAEADGSLGQSRGAAWGGEALIRRRGGDMDLMATARYARSLRQEDPGDAWLPYPYEQPLSLGLIAAAPLGAAWTLSGRFRAASGLPAPTEETIAVDLLTQTERELTYSAWDPGRLPPHHALDLKLAWRRPLARGEVQVYLDVQNVYNRRIPEPVITGIDGVETALTYGMPVLPLFGAERSW